MFDEVAEIFGDMGFAVAEGPDIETDDLNFTKLNIPPEHPARQEHDTFYMKRSGAEGDNAPIKVLRTHTSPVQIRTMMSQKPPIRVIVPGRVYRMDSDATHTPMFHQIEGLVIDEETHLGHLKWCLEEFCKAFFEVDEVRMRFRASHFPFTEPSMEVDIDAAAIGKPGQWLEILGSAAWCTPTSSATAASIPTSIRASPSAWASTASPCSSTASPICATCSPPTCAGSGTTASPPSTCRRWPAACRRDGHAAMSLPSPLWGEG